MHAGESRADVTALVNALSPGARILREAPLTGGVSAETRKLVLSGSQGEETVVVRRHRDVDGKAPPAERAEREAALLKALEAGSIPAPRVRLFSPPRTLVLTFVEGDAVFPEAGAGPMARALAAIHRLGAADGLPALPQLTDPMPALRAWLPERLGGAPDLPAYAGGERLIHGDYWPGNFLWRDGEIAAVLDWEDALLGDPVIDVATARCELNWMRGAQAVEAFTAAYAASAPLDEARLPWWDLFVSTAALLYMDGWGLAPDTLEQRRSATRAWQARALEAIGQV